MTAEQAIGEISVLSKPGDWHCDGIGYIRHSVTQQCPICWLANQHGKNILDDRVAWWHVSGSIGMTEEEGRYLASAADDYTDRPDKSRHIVLRKKLVAACHLSSQG